MCHPRPPRRHRLPLVDVGLKTSYSPRFSAALITVAGQARARRRRLYLAGALVSQLLPRLGCSPTSPGARAAMALKRVHSTRWGSGQVLPSRICGDFRADRGLRQLRPGSTGSIAQRDASIGPRHGANRLDDGRAAQRVRGACKTPRRDRGASPVPHARAQRLGGDGGGLDRTTRPSACALRAPRDRLVFVAEAAARARIRQRSCLSESDRVGANASQRSSRRTIAAAPSSPLAMYFPVLARNDDGRAQAFDVDAPPRASSRARSSNAALLVAQWPRIMRRPVSSLSQCVPRQALAHASSSQSRPHVGKPSSGA